MLYHVLNYSGLLYSHKPISSQLHSISHYFFPAQHSVMLNIYNNKNIHFISYSAILNNSGLSSWVELES